MSEQTNHLPLDRLGRLERLELLFHESHEWSQLSKQLSDVFCEKLADDQGRLFEAEPSSKDAMDHL